MHFSHPQFLYLLLLAPIYLLWLYFDKKSDSGISVSVFLDLLKARGRKKISEKILRYIKYLLVVMMIIFFSITLARPQGEHEKEDVSKKGVDIIIAIDVSESMMAEDLKPNRMEAAKKALEKFTSKLENDRLGLVVFAGQAFTQSPLTFDYNILTQYIKNISTNSVNKNVRGLSGTAIGDAILSAVNRFKESEDRTKVLIVITDGDANTGVDPNIAAKKASEEGIKVYTVGVGSKDGAPMPVKDLMGKKTYAKNQDGSLMMATFNANALKKIADLGGGKYFRADDDETFNTVMDEINSLEKREIKISKTTEYSERFTPYLYPLAVMFLLYLGILFFEKEVK